MPYTHAPFEVTPALSTWDRSACSRARSPDLPPRRCEVHFDWTSTSGQARVDQGTLPHLTDALTHSSPSQLPPCSTPSVVGLTGVAAPAHIVVTPHRAARGHDPSPSSSPPEVSSSPRPWRANVWKLMDPLCGVRLWEGSPPAHRRASCLCTTRAPPEPSAPMRALVRPGLASCVGRTGALSRPQGHFSRPTGMVLAVLQAKLVRVTGNRPSAKI
jgi:hypothetical protein